MERSQRDDPTMPVFCRQMEDELPASSKARRFTGEDNQPHSSKGNASGRSSRIANVLDFDLQIDEEEIYHSAAGKKFIMMD